MTELFNELESLRLERDWSYQELSDAIASATNRRRNQDCWRRICQGEVDRPQGRTLAILESFLATVRSKPPQQRRRTA